MGEKPFWLEEPWITLIDLSKMSSIDPWSIDLKMLILGFLEKLKSYGLINFSIPGIVLLSSATIFKLKVEYIFKPFTVKVEKDREQSEGKTRTTPTLDIPTIDLPLRYNFASLDIESILKLLIEVLEEASKVRIEPPSIDKLIEDSQSFILEESFESKIETWIGELEERIRTLLWSGYEYISFRKIVENMDLRSQIRMFIALLFLAHQGKVDLFQDESESDLIISVEGYKVWLKS
ncbi:MAG: hypothetical protein QW374_00880 [Candidatus Bathyarchaeia archaeon]|nr:hypothetical protein [Candidatus Bathyarchaeota archaeon]